MTVAWAGYRALAPLAGVAAPLARWLAPAAERPLWPERLGELPARGEVEAWVHAASLGEAVAVTALLSALRESAPAARFQLTATTRTGRERLAALGEPAALAPLDTPQAAARFFSRARPHRLLLLETELWPHWLLAARARRVPVAVLSARLSQRSLARYRWLGPEFRALVAGLDAVLCQGESDRERWLALGARPERAVTVGNLKNDGLPDPAADRGAARAGLGLDPARPLLVLGSLRPGEAAPMAAAWLALEPSVRERWQVAAVPRHPHASEGQRREARSAGVPIVDTGAPAAGAWRWEGRAGVLRDYYAAADVVWVGGTLGPYGGHNPLEPAASGAAVMAGPHLEAQTPAVAALEAEHGLVIAEAGDAMAAALHGLLADEVERARRAAAALKAARAAKGATARAVALLIAWGLWPS